MDKLCLSFCRRYLGLLKRDFRRHAARGISTLRTPYRGLVLQDVLNYESCPSTPRVKIVSEAGDWKILEVGEFRFFWPREYSIKGLEALYQDTFAPASCNPHAFEMGDICIKAGDWVIDAGACEGFFTHYALKRGANVLMIEPIPMLAEALSRTFESEIEAGRVRLLRGAIDAETDVKKLMIPEGGPIAASTDPNWNVDVNWSLRESREQRVELPVKVYTLDSIVEKGIIPRVDFLKMDIENAEVAAVRGAVKLLHSQMPVLSIAVYHGFLNAQIIRSLVLQAQSKYQVWWRGMFIRESYGLPRPYMLYAKEQG